MIKKSLEKCVFGTLRKLDSGGVLGVGSAAKAVWKRSRVKSSETNFMLIFFENSIGEDLQKHQKTIKTHKNTKDITKTHKNKNKRIPMDPERNKRHLKS